MEETLIPRQPVLVTPKSKPLWASRLWNENTKDNQSQTAKLALSYKQSNNFLPLLLPLLCPSLSWLLWGRAHDHSPFGAVRCQLIFLLKQTLQMCNTPQCIFPINRLLKTLKHVRWSFYLFLCPFIFPGDLPAPTPLPSARTNWSGCLVILRHSVTLGLLCYFAKLDSLFSGC